MITNEEKINFIINCLDNINMTIKSFIDNADSLTEKYVLSEELEKCNAKKNALMLELEKLGGIWEDLD
jgi:hypothetical protein